MSKLNYRPDNQDRYDELEMIKLNLEGIIDEIVIYDDIKEALRYDLYDLIDPELEEVENDLREEEKREEREREREWYNSRQ